MPIIIRHNSVANNLAQGFAAGSEGMARGMAAQQEMAMAQQRLQLLKDENDRLIREKAQADESARSLAEWSAKYAGQDPGQPVSPSMVGPRNAEQDQWERVQTEKMQSFRRMVAGAPEKQALQMAGEFQRDHQMESMERARQMAISHWQSLARDPGAAGADIQGEDGGEAANRAALMIQDLEAAPPEQLPDLLQASSVAYAKTNEQLAKRQRRVREAASVAARWAPKLDELAMQVDQLRAMGEDEAADILEEKYRYQSQVLDAYSVNPGESDAMDLAKLMYSGPGGRSAARSGTQSRNPTRQQELDARPAWIRAREMALEDAKAGALGDLTGKTPEEADKLIRSRMQEYERQFGSSQSPAAQGVQGPAQAPEQQGPPPISFKGLAPEKQAALMSELSNITSDESGDADREAALKKYGVSIDDIQPGIEAKQKQDTTNAKEAEVQAGQRDYRAEQSKRKYIDGPATGFLKANNSARQFSDGQKLVSIAKDLKAAGHTRSIGGGNANVVDYREKASGKLQAAMDEYVQAWGEIPKKVMDEIERLRREFAREAVK